MSQSTLPLDCAEAEISVPLVGGKAANLAALIRAGFPVPPGFVITTHGFRAFTEANRRLNGVLEIGGAVPAANLVDSEDALCELRHRIDQGAIPEGLKREILIEYRHLNERARTLVPDRHHTVPSSSSHEARLPVAVRSSATIEDLDEGSFAGGQESLLNVEGEVALLAAVKRCWSSVLTPRALFEFKRRGIDPADVGLAVVVQQLVPADAAGILFTANPVTGNAREVVINAGWGLGQAVASGRVTPDTVVVDKATRRLTGVEVGDKTIMTVLTPGGTAEQPVERRRRERQVLTPTQVRALVDLGCAVEGYFGRPQDVEWAIAGEQIHVLQSRPVTTLSDAAVRTRPPEAPVPGDDHWPAVDERPAQDFDLWTHMNVGEIWPQPVSPLMWSGVPFIVGTCTRYALRGLSSPQLEAVQWAARRHGRVYYNEGGLAYVLAEELGLPGSFADAALGSRRGANPTHEKFRPARFIRRLPFSLRFTTSLFRSGPELERMCSQVEEGVARFRARPLTELTDREMWTELTRWVNRFIEVMKVNTELSISSIMAFSLLHHLTTRWCVGRVRVQDLVSGLSGVHSAEMAMALWRMAQWLSSAGLDHVVLENDPKVALTRLQETREAAPVIQMLETFLQRYGHHCPNEGEWLYPRWIDAPELAIGVVRGYLRAGEKLHLGQGTTGRHQGRADAVAWINTHLAFAKRAILLRVLRRTQRLVRLRDNGKNCYMQALYPVRRTYASLGERWSRIGWLAEPEDIFFLTASEVERIVEHGTPADAGLAPASVVAERRKAFTHWFSVDAPDIIGSDGRPVAMAPDPDVATPVLQGIPVSSGLAQGIVRVVQHADQAAHLQPCDVLVTRATDPGWTPFFPLVAGMVVEIGGQLSHWAIIAREYGVPAVANVRDATRRLRTGQRITVDGGTGQIYLHAADEPDRI